MGYSVRLGKSQSRVDVEFGLGVQTVADPPHSDVADIDHAGFGGKCGFGCVQQRGVHAVHQAPKHIARGGPQDGEDRGGDDQADDRVSQRKAECDPAGAEQYGQRGESVGARVHSVGDQSR